MPDPLHLSWRGNHVRVRHADPRLGLYSAVIARLRTAMMISSETAPLRLVIAREAAYDIRVSTTAARVRLRRRT